MAAMWSPIIGLLLLLQLAPSSSSYIQLPLQGSVHPVGYFYVTMNIGGKPYSLDIDTGSNLTWLECNYPGHQCNPCKGPHLPYVPNITHKKVMCGDQFCTDLHKDLPYYPERGCDIHHPHECHYHIQYVGGTSSDGFIVNDTVSVNVLSPSHPSRRVQIFFGFGCGCNQKPHKDSPVDGVLGLGMGKEGFVAQLKARNVIRKDIIGHCLSIDGGGYLFVGEHGMPSGITWVPMRKYSHYYTPGPAQLLLGGEKIGSQKMAVFDSGTTYTYIPDQVYSELVREVKRSVSGSLQRVADHALPVCWKGPFQSIQLVKRKFKPLALEFTNKVMHIPPENYLALTGEKNVCLGILQTPKAGGQMIIIGDVTMQDLLVIYDNEQKLVGWISKQCKHTLEIPSIHAL
ncbi:aspartic proteinase Asp1-like [Triticum dicoccoides]|uniref:aspartic proteinase Asp1-like n=1 Tax=Triticum dicoccoides TaxID=85692 RepID=UPI00188E1286|nr:aspartic proteinase Asp1-like [Triticum dicoccoides]